jgi:hypothetical protein
MSGYPPSCATSPSDGEMGRIADEKCIPETGKSQQFSRIRQYVVIIMRGMPTRRGRKPPKASNPLNSLAEISTFPLFREPPIMDTETLGILLGTVLPLYPLLFAIYRKTGRYDEIVREFRRLRAEHDKMKGAYHGH